MWAVESLLTELIKHGQVQVVFHFQKEGALVVALQVDRVMQLSHLQVEEAKTWIDFSWFSGQMI